MKAKLIVNNQEIEVEISEEEYKKLQPQPKQTGYERVSPGQEYHYVDWNGDVTISYDDHSSWDDQAYDIVNYYSDRTVAKNNARADKLMRQLRRFAVEHREKEIDWNDGDQKKYFIYYRYAVNKVDIEINYEWRVAGLAYFDSQETAQLAIDTFHDELIWYFTEYKDSL